MDPALQELLAEGSPDDEVAVILRLTEPAVVPDGVRIVAQFGHIATCRLRREDIPRVRGQDQVRSMKAARLYGPTPMDAAEGDAGNEAPEPTDLRRRGENLPTGRNVVVAHIDWGVDFAHPDFRNADGRTRLRALWNQSSPSDPQKRNRYGYGRIYHSEDIDRALATPEPYKTLGYDPADSDPRAGSHGTHTLSIAAGNGRAGGPAGIAPDAELVFVHLSTYTAEGPASLGDSVALLEALDFIANVAGPCPLVVNASLGRQAGDHTGKSLTEQGMDAFLLAAPGRAIVQSTGNYYNRHIHAMGELRPGAAHTLRFQTDAAERTFNELDLWYPGVDRLQVTVRGPAGSVTVHAGPGERVSLQVNGEEVGRLYHRLCDPNCYDNEVTLFLYRAAPPGEWEITLFGEDVVDGRFHAWIERDAACAGCQAHFIPADSNPTCTTGTICNGLRTLAVGAYDAHQEERPLGSFSSSGPTRDGRQKPDLVAPGVRILAARSHPRDVAPGSDPPLLTRMTGTSMAAPHVTGTIALMFAAAARPLAIEETHRLLLAHVDPAPEDADPAEHNRVGSGYLNIEAAVTAAAQAGERLSAPVKLAEAVSSPGTSSMFDDLSEGSDGMDTATEESGPRPMEELDSAASSPENFVESRRDSPLPFQVELPIGGGPPALALPFGNSPIAFTVPLGSTAPAQAPVVVQTVTGQPFSGAASSGTSSAADAPVTVARSDVPLYVPPAEGNDSALGAPETPAAPASDSTSRPVAPEFGQQTSLPRYDREADFEMNTEPKDVGDHLLMAADRAARSGDLALHRTAPLLDTLLNSVLPLSPLGSGCGHRPSASELFNAFVYPDHPVMPRTALRRHYGLHLDVLALPGEPLEDLALRAGDLLIRVARGERWGHLAVIAAPKLYAHDHLEPIGLRGEYGPSPATGRYVHVVEAGPRPHPCSDGFARRVSDASGLLLPDTLLLRLKPPVTEATLPADAEWDVTGDLSDAFFTGMWTTAANIGADPHHLLGVMNSESGIKPYAENPDGHAVGLIQFMPKTLEGLGWTQGYQAFEILAAEDQLPYVERFYSPYKRYGLDSTGRLYQATFLPATLGRGSDPDTVIASTDDPNPTIQAAYIHNKGFDTAKKGYITVGDLTAAVARHARGSRWNEAVSRLDAAGGQQPAPPPAPSQPIPGDMRPVLKVGSSGPSVTDAQHKLNTVHARQIAAASPGLAQCPLVEDGIFGTKTRAATVSFQQLAFPGDPTRWDGVIGPLTWAQLDKFSTAA